MPRAPVIALSHGGGPMPVLGDPSQAKLAQSLKKRVPQILKLGTTEAPRAIVLVTAHWSADVPTISNGKKPKLYYDYGGFPPAAYKLKYDAPGSPEVAGEVEAVLKAAGLKPRTDSERGWDHGVFIPMLLVHPAADIPIVQLSVLGSESPAAHLAMGRALLALRDRNVAIVGSGFASIHNLRVLLSGQSSDADFLALNRDFSAAVTAAASASDRKDREGRFADWRNWPGADLMHPPSAGEHFMPLIVCAGAVGEGDTAGHYADDFMGIPVYSYYWT